ncbi:MAG: SH3 domain-containing protein [Pseudomonadota bacterium]|nr:SH3 domain-containing protein [Pseudomonadota bacterium]
MALECHYELTLDTVNHSRQKKKELDLTRRFTRRFEIFVSCVVFPLALMPLVARAQLVTRFTTYMHSGPGLEYSVTDEIPNQTALAPQSCTNGWCRISYNGAPGWVQQNLLINGPSTAQPKPGERPTECMDFARTGWPDAGDLERVCIFRPSKPIGLDKPAG